MEACAWVLGRSRRPPGRDAWATSDDEMLVSRDAGDAAVFGAPQHCSGWPVSARMPLKIKCLRSQDNASAGG